MLKLFKRKKKDMPRIVKRSNVIQYDEMGGSVAKFQIYYQIR